MFGALGLLYVWDDVDANSKDDNIICVTFSFSLCFLWKTSAKYIAARVEDVFFQ